MPAVLEQQAITQKERLKVQVINIFPTKREVVVIMDDVT